MEPVSGRSIEGVCGVSRPSDHPSAKQLQVFLGIVRTVSVQPPPADADTDSGRENVAKR